MTPGREDTEDTKLYTRADYNEKKNRDKATGDASQSETKSQKDSVSSLIEKGLGGKSNIASRDCCATRLRVSVNDPALVSEPLLKESGALGVIKSGGGVQVIYGPSVSVIKSELEEYLEGM